MGSLVAKVIPKPFVYPDSDEDSWSEIIVKEYNVNSKTHYALLQALNNDDISRVIHCTSAYHIWQVLITTYEGTTQVKKAKINLLTSQYESFYMLDGESIDEMLTQFITITNELVSLCKLISNDQKMWKIIRVLLKSWKIKTVTLKELSDDEKIDFTASIKNWKPHEMKMKAREDCEPQKKTSIVLKASLREHKKKGITTSTILEEDEQDDEELILLVKNIRRM